MIDPKKKYTTKHGYEVAELLQRKNGNYIVVLSEMDFNIYEVTSEGIVIEGSSNFDLIEVKEKKQLTGFLNIYKKEKERTQVLHHTKEQADRVAYPDRLACLDLSKYNIFYEEGEGI